MDGKLKIKPPEQLTHDQLNFEELLTVLMKIKKGDFSARMSMIYTGMFGKIADTLNEIIELNEKMAAEYVRKLKELTRLNNEQDWLITNLAKFTRLLQGQHDLISVTKMVLSELAPLVSIQHGVVYLTDKTHEEPVLKLCASYGYQERRRIVNEFKPGESLVGQCYLEKQRILLTDVPNDYILINSGLGEALPLSIMLMPVLFEEQVLAVIELASFQHFSLIHQTFLDQATEAIGIVLNTIQANMRSEDLLKQSQLLAKELQDQQDVLQETNEKLADKAKLLAEQNQEVEKKNIEVELAKQSIEEKATQLTLTSKYKSQFLANMSHELRTPLNNLMILSQQLSENADGNLRAQQVEAAKIINASGGDLLNLINDVLDLSKIESGIVTIEPSEFSIAELHDYLERTFRSGAHEKNLHFGIEIGSHLPRTLWTDNKRLSQVLKNILANAFKFTAKGEVVLRIETVQKGWNKDIETLNNADYVLAFVVSDTGIGIAVENQALIFEAFQQTDGMTCRKYGGTGLGLSISREIAHLLGGDIRVDSTPGQGSSFTLYLPQSYVAIRPNDSHLPDDSQFSEDKSSLYYGESRPETEAIQTLALIPDLRAVFEEEQLLLIIEDDRAFADILVQMAQASGFRTHIVTRGEGALVTARKLLPDAITLDIGFSGMDGWEILQQLKADSLLAHIPVHTISFLQEQDQDGGRQMDAFTAFLLKVQDDLDTCSAAEQNISDDTILVNKLVLIVDDDIRNIFALSSVLERQGMNVISAENGKQGIEVLLSTPDIDFVLMDIMMPEMDGFEAMRIIRSMEKFNDLPVFALTAKAMRGDREKCLECGANEHVTKPIDIEQLLTLLRAWLSK